MAVVGVIGGSGLDDPDILKTPNDVDVQTPFGRPSSPLREGTISGTKVYLLARHGREHTIPPTQVNYRANVFALKDVGCSHIIATTAVGSLREEIGRGDLAVPDQFIDFTRHRKVSFYESFEPGEMKHTPMADPFSAELRRLFVETCAQLGLSCHENATVITIEGPRFSTRAESRMFRGWGADLINMSIAPECILANEAGIPYATIAMSTDYDSWKDDEEPVTWEAVLETFLGNSEKVKSILVSLIPKIRG